MQLSLAEQGTGNHQPGVLSAMQLQRLEQAVEGLSEAQLSWAGGYLAGIASRQQSSALAQEKEKLTVLYASQTGNSRLVAEALVEAGEARGFEILLVSAEQYKPRDLARERLLLLIVSTHGEGEPPESAAELYRFLHSQRAPRLTGLNYAVFGLGDSSYAHFCKAARDFDKRLQRLGGSRIMERVEADLDFQTSSGNWLPRILGRIDELRSSDPKKVVSLSHVRHSRRPDRNNPYSGLVLENRRITTQNAVADVRHIALQVDPRELKYAPGDAVGVWFHNDPALVDEILRSTRLDGDTPVSFNEQSVALAELLTTKLELTQLHPKVVAHWAQLNDSEALRNLAADSEALRRYCADRQVWDLLSENPANLDAVGLVESLQPLQPRLYSIASSQTEYPDELHLTVSVVRYRAHGRDHLGGASGYLGKRLDEGARLSLYVVENHGFHLPGDGATPIIMIGAGTGVAPFRAFLQQRAAEGASGKNWLIFGNRHFHRDFLYQNEWLAQRDAGLLTRATVAFSRDDTRGCYVQDRLLEQGAELYHWLQEGAALYVCGGSAMERGVREALVLIAQSEGGLETEAAAEYVETLRSAGRYLRDVY